MWGKAVAVGEIGIYYWHKEAGSMSMVQKKVFRQQMEIAREKKCRL